ncbi:hypothetical protein [Streptomyces gardneri]|uniref:hypothetical protein n=1 Tax=Streptomyces gardneri TaxID=66892 RepID=UPI00142F0580
MVDQALSVLLLDGVVHGLDVSELAVASLDVVQVRLEVEADVVLVPVGRRAGQALLPLEPRFQVLADGGVAEYVRALDGLPVELGRLLLRLVLGGEAATADAAPGVVLAGFQLEVEVPRPVLLVCLEPRAGGADEALLLLALVVQDRIAVGVDLGLPAGALARVGGIERLRHSLILQFLIFRDDLVAAWATQQIRADVRRIHFLTPCHPCRRFV